MRNDTLELLRDLLASRVAEAPRRSRVVTLKITIATAQMMADALGELLEGSGNG